MFGLFRKNPAISQMNINQWNTFTPTPPYRLVDVRTAEEFQGEGHIPGSINIPVEQLMAKSASKLPNKSETIYLYCYSGSRSSMAANMLARQGYAALVDLGGIMSWKGPVSYGNK